MGAPPQIQFTLFGHRFKIACAEEDKKVMREAASVVESKREELRRKTRVADGERAALMTALQVAFEARKGEIARPAPGEFDAHIAALCERIDAAITNAEKNA